MQNSAGRKLTCLMNCTFLWFLILAPVVNSGPKPAESTPAVDKVCKNWTKTSAEQSQGSKEKLLIMLGDPKFRNEIDKLPKLASKTPEELLKMLTLDISHSPISHNVPMRYAVGAAEGKRGTLGVDVAHVMSYGYIPNVYEEIANHDAVYNAKAAQQDKCEYGLMHFPKISTPTPNFTEAQDRPVYTAVNIWRHAGGNFEFGTVGFFVDTSKLLPSRFFISPIDTGFYCAGCGTHLGLEKDDDGDDDAVDNKDLGDNCWAWDRNSFGTFDHFWHLVIPHIYFWDYPLSDLFLRIYNQSGHPVSPGHFRYFEAVLAGAYYIPEHLQHVAIAFSEFATPAARKIQIWVKLELHRPLVWALDANSPMVIDTFVNGTSGVYWANQTDLDTWNELWNTNASWPTVTSRVHGHLHLHYFTSMTVDKCNTTKCDGCTFLGVDSFDWCVFYHHQPTHAPTTTRPTISPTIQPTTQTPTMHPTTHVPSTHVPTTHAPSTASPTTHTPTTIHPTTSQPTIHPTTLHPTTHSPSTVHPTTSQPTKAPATAPPQRAP